MFPRSRKLMGMNECANFNCQAHADYVCHFPNEKFAQYCASERVIARAICDIRHCVLGCFGRSSSQSVFMAQKKSIALPSRRECCWPAQEHVCSFRPLFERL
jgi:hypothetical protein